MPGSVCPAVGSYPSRRPVAGALRPLRSGGLFCSTGSRDQPSVTEGGNAESVESAAARCNWPGVTGAIKLPVQTP